MDLSSGLSMRVANAAGWRLANAGLRLCLQVAVLAVLARLLSVNEFGLMGQALVVVGLVNVLAQVGMASAIIQSRELSRCQIETAITVSLAGGMLFTILAWLSAPLLAWVYGSNECVPVMRALAPIFAFNAVGTAAMAVEQRNLDFRKLLWIDAAAYGTGYGGVAIALAWSGFGVWALVAGALGEQLVRAIAALWVTNHRPCFPPKLRESRDLLRFGMGMSVTAVVMYVARNVDQLVIGRVCGPAALGLYSRSYQLMMMPLTRFSTVMNSVAFPAYARLQTEPERLRRALYQNIQFAVLAVFPFLAVLAAMGYETIVVALGSKWEAAVAPLKWLCVAGMLRSASEVGEIVIRAKGEVRGRLKRYLFTAPAMIVSVSIGTRWGIQGAAVGVLAVVAIQYLLMAQLVLRLVEGKWADYLRAHVPGTAAAIWHGALALIVAAILREQQLSNVAVLIISAAVCVMSYSLTILAFGNYLLPASVRHVFHSYRAAMLRRSGFRANRAP